MKKRNYRFSLPILLLLLLVVLLSAMLAGSLVVIDKLQKNNLFSKSILLDSNYFLSQYADPDLPREEKESDIPVSEESFINGLLQAVFDEDAVFHMTDAPEYRDQGEVEAENPEWMLQQTILLVRFNLEEILSDFNGINDDSLGIIQDYLTDYTGNPEMRQTVLICAGLLGGEKQIEIPYISQEGILPNGCESVSAVMLLCHAGYETDPLDFVSEYLDCQPVSIRFGCRYGPNPKYHYAGDPKSEKNGLGCFAPVIVKAMNSAITAASDSRTHQAVNLTGMPLQELCKRYIDQDIPVAIWATVGMGEVSRMIQWQSPDRSETFLYPSNEHCLVLIGYDDEKYIFADPYDSLGIVSYPKQDVLTAYAMLGKQAVAILRFS